MTELYQSKFVELKDLKMHYLEAGKGYPLILLHGGIATAEFNWKKQIEFFSKYYRVIAPDSRGHGKTNNPTGEFSYKLMAKDIANFIQTLNLKQPFICGWSDGGQIALEVGINYPHIAKALVVGGALVEVSEHYFTGMKAWGLEEPGKVNFEQMKNVLPGFIQALPELHGSIYGLEYWKKLLVDISKMWLNQDEFPYDRIKNIQDPTLIIQGDRDSVIPVYEAEKIYRLIENSELAILPGSDHDVYDAKADLFNSIVLDFLIRHSG